MAKPPEDPRIADLARFRKQRETEALKKLRKPPKPAGSSFLGSNPRAGLILAALAALLVLFFVVPAILPLLK